MKKQKINVKVVDPKKDPAYQESMEALKDAPPKNDKKWQAIGLRVDNKTFEYLSEVAEVRGLSVAGLCRSKIMELIHIGRL